MGLLDVLRIPSRMLATDGKANRALPLEARGEMSIYAGSVSPRYKDFNSYLKAYRIPWVHSAVGVIAYNASNVGYRLVELDPDGNEVRAVTSSPLLTLLTRPNPVQSGFDLVERSWIDLELTGNAFLSLERADIAGFPTEMYRLRPDRVTVVPDAQKLVGYYLYTVNGKSVRYEVDEMLHMSYPNPEDDLYGMGMIEAAEQRMDSQMAMAEHERTFWRGGAKITGVLTTDSTVPDNVWNRLKTSIQTFFRGSGYSTLMLESGLKYQSVSDGPAKLGMLDMSKASRDEILAIFGVPPTKVGILENANYKAQASDEFFWTETIDPKLSRLENDLDVLVEMFHPGQNLHIRYDRLNFTDDLPVASVAKLLTDSNSRTINEIRSYQGLDPLPGGDIITIAAAGIALDLSTSTPSVIQLKDASSVEPALPNPALPPGAPPQPALPAPAASAKARTSTNHPATGHRLMKHRAETLKKALRHVPALQTFFAGQEKRVKARVMSKQVRKAGLSLFDDPLEDGKLVDVVTPIHEDGMAAGYDAANSVGVAATFTLANPKLVLLQDQLATQVTRVNQTTKDDISATVAQGLDRGYSVQQIANGTSDGEYGGIRGVFEQARGYRAELIARTETMHAYNGASLTAYDDSGQVDEVEFMDGDDDPECAAVNGTTATLDEAQDILDAEHPNGTRVAIPIVKPYTPPAEDELGPDAEQPPEEVDAVTSENPPNSQNVVYSGPLMSEDTYREVFKKDTSYDITVRADTLGIPESEYTAQVMTNLSHWLDVSEIRISVPPYVVDDILSNGFKNQHETGTSGGILDPKMRSRAEQYGWDLPKTAKASDYPIYGSLEHPDYVGTPDYGDIALVMNPDVKSRATFTGMDSLGALDTHRIGPSPIVAPRIESLTGGYRYGGMRAMEGVGVSDKTLADNIHNEVGYVEAQIFGGVAYDDIARVEITTYKNHPIETMKSVTDKLDELKIPWKERPDGR